MTSISFPAGGSLYYAHDLEKVSGRAAISLKDERFCIGSDTRLPMWYRGRSQLNVDRGLYESAEAALVAVACKELAYLEQFGQPVLSFRRERRDGYQYQKQSPLAHIENLKRYLVIASSIVPWGPRPQSFLHPPPRLQQSSIIVRLLDRQHASILLPFLLAGVPQRLQNHDDPVSQSMSLPSLPENSNELEETKRAAAEQVYHRCLVHYHYVTNTEEYNKPHYDATTDPMCILRSRLFYHAGNLWEGETLELNVALIQATERWEALTGGGAPCPVVFDAEDVHETMRLNDVQSEADGTFEVWQSMLGLAHEGWVLTQDYKKAMAFCKQMKEAMLKEATSEGRAEITTHWPWGDTDEEKYYM